MGKFHPSVHIIFSCLSINPGFCIFVNPLLKPLKYHVFENVMENGAFAPKEQMLHFP